MNIVGVPSRMRADLGATNERDRLRHFLKISYSHSKFTYRKIEMHGACEMIQQIRTALQFIKSTDKVDSVSARQFLGAAANEDDKTLFYTVYMFFVGRNMWLPRKPNFPPDQHCQPHEALFKKWFKDLLNIRIPCFVCIS